jgi:hypothetical protein
MYLMPCSNGSLAPLAYGATHCNENLHLEPSEQDSLVEQHGRTFVLQGLDVSKFIADAMLLAKRGPVIFVRFKKCCPRGLEEEAARVCSMVICDFLGCLVVQESMLSAFALWAQSRLPGKVDQGFKYSAARIQILTAQATETKFCTHKFLQVHAMEMQALRLFYHANVNEILQKSQIHLNQAIDTYAWPALPDTIAPMGCLTHVHISSGAQSQGLHVLPSLSIYAAQQNEIESTTSAHVLTNFRPCSESEYTLPSSSCDFAISVGDCQGLEHVQCAEQTCQDGMITGNVLGLPSLGSALHGKDNLQCHPCCFFLRGKCKLGKECTHCHFSHERQKRAGKKSRTRARKRRLLISLENGDSILQHQAGTQREHDNQESELLIQDSGNRKELSTNHGTSWVSTPLVGETCIKANSFELLYYQSSLGTKWFIKNTFLEHHSEDDASDDDQPVILRAQSC